MKCRGGKSVKGLPEERAVKLAQYIIEQDATVRQAAKKFVISKSTVHKDVTPVSYTHLTLPTKLEV